MILDYFLSIIVNHNHDTIPHNGRSTYQVVMTITHACCCGLLTGHHHEILLQATVAVTTIDRYWIPSLATVVSDVIIMVSCHLYPILDDLFRSMIRIAKELHRTTYELFKFNNRDKTIKYKNPNKAKLVWSAFGEEMKCWTDLLKLKVRRYEELQHETNNKTWNNVCAHYSNKAYSLILNIIEAKSMCSVTSENIRNTLRVIEISEATEPGRTDTSQKGFLQQVEKQITKILAETDYVHHKIAVAFKKDILSDNNSSACNKRSQSCSPEFLGDSKPAAKKR